MEPEHRPATGASDLEKRWLPNLSRSTAPGQEGSIESSSVAPHRGGSHPLGASDHGQTSRGVHVPRWLLAASALLLIALGGSAAFFALNDSSAGNAPGPTASDATPPASPPVTVPATAPASEARGARPTDDPFELDGVRWAVFANPKQDWTDFTRSTSAGSGRTWLTLSVRVRNLAQPGFAPFRLPFVLTGESGASYATDARYGSGPLVTQGAPTVQVGKTGQVELAYKVPREETAFTLRFASRGFGGRPIAVTIPPG